MEELSEDIQNIQKILPKDIQATWPNESELYKYIQKLGNCDLQQLQREKQKLTEESSEIIVQTQELAITNYKKFIETAENTRNIYQQFITTESKLNELVEKLPKFEQKSKCFTNESNEISIHRKLSTLMFQKTGQLTDFLQLPELMESSIVNGNYEDALEIVDFVRRFASKYPETKIFVDFVDVRTFVIHIESYFPKGFCGVLLLVTEVLLSQVEKLWLVIVQKLLSQLRSDIQLPKCLQAVGYLRCMNIFSEAELRLKFLQTRDSWLQSLLDEIPKDKASQHLCKTIELSRIHIFHIITQYNAIFCDNSKVMLRNDDNINECAIFQSWIQEKISQFLKTMEQDLNECEGSTFGSTLSQCMYFGLSFSKVGCDFRGLAAPIMAKCVRKHFQQAIENVTKKFKKDMECFTLINKVYIVKKSDAQIKSATNSLEKVQDFYPLAEYCNGLLTALNDLRVCAPLALVCFITDSIKVSLESVANVILLFYQHEHQAFSEIANEQFSYFCKCFVYELVPYIQNCIKTVYPPLQVSLHLGVTVQFLEKGKYMILDREAIISPIKHLLPIRLDTDVAVQNSDTRIETEPENVEKLMPTSAEVTS